MERDGTAGLSSQQKQAARLEFAAEHNADAIGEKVGVSRTTIFRWRKNPEYVAYVNSLHDEANRLTILELVKIRKRVMKGVYAGTGKLLGVVEGKGADAPSTYDVVQATRTLHDIMKSTAAQTGISERKTVEHAGNVQVDARADGAALVDSLLSGKGD